MQGAGFPAFKFLIISIPLMILISIFSLSVPEHHELLFSTFDFIIVAKSSPLAVFFMCNVITIIAVLLGSPGEHQDAASSHRLITASEYDIDHIAKDEENDDNYKDDSEVEDLDEYHIHGYDGYDEENDDDLDTEDDQDSEVDEKDNDLERRIEDFISKVTQKWREELLTERLLCIRSS